MPQHSLIHSARPATDGQPLHPCLILLHGLGSNELDLHSLITQLDPRIYALSVRAPFEHPWGGYAWYDLAEGPGLVGAGIEASLDALRSFVEEALEAYPINPSQVYVGGFSMGAAMSAALALLEPDRIAGAVIISGYLPPPTAEQQYRVEGASGHPFFQVHGTLDTVVPIQYARQTRDYLRATSVELTYREYPIGHEVSLEEIEDLAVWFQTLLSTRSTSISSR